MQLGTSNTHAVDFITAAGVPVPWTRVFLQSQQWSATAYRPVTDAKARGQRVILSNKLPSGVSMAQVGTGSGDAFFNAIFAGLAAAGVSDGVYVLYHEPEDNVQAGEFTAAAWRAAQARVAGLLHSSPLVGWRFATCLMGWTLTPPSGRNPEDYYVPQADLLLWDSYNVAGSHEPDQPYAQTDPMLTTPASVLQPVVDYCTAKSKPYGFAEFGCARQQADAAGARRTAWLNAVADSGLVSGAEFCCYFDMGTIDGKAEWAIRSEPASMTAFKRFDDETPAQTIARLSAELAAAQASLATANAAVAALTAANASLSGALTSLTATLAARDALIAQVHAETA